MKIVKNKHDEFVKTMLEYPDIAKDFFEAHLPAAVREKVLLDTLHPEKTSFIDKDFNKHESDIIFSVELINHEKALLYTLVEHQSESDELMPFRLSYYIFQLIKRHILQSKKDDKKALPLPLVYPIVLYNGIAPYSHSLDIFPLFGELENFAREVFLQPFKLIDVASMSEDDFQKHKWAGIMELSLRRAQHMKFDALVALLGRMFLGVQITHNSGDERLQSVLQYIIRKYDIAKGDPTTYIDTMRRLLPSEYAEDIMTLEQAIEARGSIKTFDHTLQAIELLKSGGHSIDEIAKETGLARKDIEKLKNSILN